PGKWDPLSLGPLPGKPEPYHRWTGGAQGARAVSEPRNRPGDRRVARPRRQPLPWIGSLNDEEAGAAHAGEAMGEENIPTEQPEAGQAPRVPSPDVDVGRPGDPVRSPAQGAGQAVGLIWSVHDRA